MVRLPPSSHTQIPDILTSAAAEDETWKKVTYTYETSAKNVRAAIEKRKAATAAALAASISPSPGSPMQVEPLTPSAKAQGKKRAKSPGPISLSSRWNPRGHELAPPFQAGLAIAKNVLGLNEGEGHDEQIVGPSTSLQDPGGARPRAGIGNRSRDAVEAELAGLMAEVEYKLDYVRFRASAVRTMAEVAEEMMDVRFRVLSKTLALRGVGVSVQGEGRDGGADVLGMYVRGSRGDGSGNGGISGHDHEPMELLRALARVDIERPPAMVGDAARRAVREVQRVEESGGHGVLGERRLTGVPPPMTPRKMPGTPRRGTTPARERDRER